MGVTGWKPSSFCAALTIGLLAPALGGAAQEAKDPAKFDTSQAAGGRVIYERFCGACHGALGKGDGQLAAGLRARPTNLTRLAAKNGGVFPFEKVARAIDGRDTVRMHGPSDMPVWGEVFAKTQGTEAKDPADAVARITHYVWSIQQPPPR
jgi:mono/diheme cytochrome c family protein